jgi:hypothetical protein
MNDTLKTSQSQRQQQTPAPRAKSRLRTALKVIAWCMLAVTLFIGGLIVCMVNVLTPEHLTPIVCKAANKSLNADVSIGRVELSLRKSFPYLNLDVDNVVVVSKSARSLDAQRHAELPQWVDTVFTLDRLNGGINVAQLLIGTIDLSDVIIDRPAANLAVIDSVTTNFDIFPESESSDTTAFDFNSLPTIRLRKFEIVNPGAVRYYDALTQGSLTANFDAVNLIGENEPMYALHFNGNITSPYLETYNLEQLKFGLNGDIEWNQKKPSIIGLKNFGFQLAFVKGSISTEIDMGQNMVVNSLDVNFAPISVQDILRIVPADIAKAWDIPADIETNAAIEIDMKLTQPFDANKQTVPAAMVTVRVPDCNLYWHEVKLDKIHADLNLVTAVNNLNAAVININDISVAGPATNLSLKGKITNIIEDPLFDGDINGSTVLQNLPPILRNMVGGYISGRIEANAHITAAPSMLSAEGYHKIRATGDIDFYKLYWVSNDTANMVYVDKACFTMGTNEKHKTENNTMADNLLAAHVTIDSVSALSGDITIKAAGITMGLATKNEAVSHSHDNDGEEVHIVPFGGGISVKRFHLVSISDSITLRMRNVKGQAVLKPHTNDIHLPEVNFNLTYDNISAGNNSTRLMLMKGHTKIDLWRNPVTEEERHIKQTIDSIRRASPDLSPDSVMAIALEKHQHHRGKYPRVHPQMQDNTEEIIDWNTSRDLKAFLHKWTIKGSITSERAGMYSMYFPLHNRFKDFNIRFNNDTIKMTNMEYKVGRSDFLVSGEFTNIKNALGRPDYRSPLKVVLTLESDTIDINQLADATFKGSDYSAATTRVDLSKIDSDHKLDSIIGSHVQDSGGSAPFLVPTNINATLRARSKNVLYSDLLLHNFNGEVLAYRGNLNLHDLSAASDMGSVNLSALYTGARKDDLGFSFALGLNDFNIHRFLNMMPAIDSIMPLLRDFSGIISADIAATSDITPEMDIDLSSLNAAIKLTGDSLVLLDPDTFKSLAKWLLFKDKNRNIIDHMNVSMIVKDNKLQVFPFMFDFDRYRLGVQGSNDLNLNFDYHVAVLKSPIPFKFGINLKGNPDKFKVRLGRAKFKQNIPAEYAIVDTTRINLVKEIGNVFRRGIAGARPQRLNIDTNPLAEDIDLEADTLTHADSLRFIQEGLIPAPDTIPVDPNINNNRKSSKKSRKKNKSTSQTEVITPSRDAAILKELAAIEPKRTYFKTTK